MPSNIQLDKVRKGMKKLECKNYKNQNVDF